MRWALIALAVAGLVLTSSAVRAQAPGPYEAESWQTPENGVDTRVLALLQEKGLESAAPCSDAVFVRRAYLDVIGTVPTREEVTQFLEDDRPDRRARLIDALMQREEFAHYWSLKWADLLRVKAEFPINLWPNAVQAYHRWIYEQVRDNCPYDEFARALLTSSGSNFRVPPVNFYRAVQSREPSGLAEAVALTLMGARTAAWPQEQRDGIALFFSRVAYKSTGEWKEEIIYPNLLAPDTLVATCPDGTEIQIAPGQDPREMFADWLITPENRWFAQAICNRVWSWLMGRGIVHEPDDIRPDNPPVNPALLSYLEDELVAADWDLQHLFRLILNSRTYQQSSLARSDDPQAEALFACYPVRRLDAEVLIDALDRIGGTGQSYTSPIPEPFTWVPEEQRTIALSDGSITSTFLQMFGRPPRDTGLEAERNNEPSDAQRLHLLNSTEVYRRIANSPDLRRATIAAAGDRDALIRGVYLTLLSREPTADEVALAQAYWQTPGISARDAEIDFAWALVNSMEFSYRH